MSGGSVLDRLSEVVPGRAVTAQREGIRRDIEALLNTRRRMLTSPAELDELEGSLLDYGLDDFTHESQMSEGFRDEFVESVERLVRRFEPRLTRFAVTIVPDQDQLDRTLRFRITGLVTLSGVAQEMQFDSHVDPVRGHFVVRP
ncbi:type VI secretion system baseplate subunit TssE [Glacieibacterium megasporae]|uniref:type VI secretion system baseplate subunit TssE n=1 Tax=Glacieibacterium megasporae TaxID=2835787 RepID=UPI001C1E69D5|nr:type VI secretion system baseplate subunit TssE [Polymorphobacter megasporae]UAJ11312.1 type VI secretion system baseplate subunit TssE [Polymorphobacter megasporae]